MRLLLMACLALAASLARGEWEKLIEPEVRALLAR
jgi:hypothetical protein